MRDRLRLGEKRGIGPWDPTYFKRDPTWEELRQDLLEQETACDRLPSGLEHLDPSGRHARQAYWEQVRHDPIVNIERALPRVAYDVTVFLYLVRLIDELACDDPRKSVYRLAVAKGFLPNSPL
ncbi:MAG: hypothetical protein ACP5QO_17610 [Clostridia bacterium]